MDTSSMATRVRVIQNSFAAYHLFDVSNVVSPNGDITCRHYRAWKLTPVPRHKQVLDWVTKNPHGNTTPTEVTVGTTSRMADNLLISINLMMMVSNHLMVVSGFRRLGY